MTQTVGIPSDVVYEVVDGEAILLELSAGQYYRLDPVGTRAWQLIAELGDLDAVTAALLAEFDVDPDRLAEDLGTLVAALRARRLLVPAGAGRG